jgi:hypothetical protein
MWAADNDPIRDMIILHHSASDQSRCDDAHAFLRVVRPMAEAVARSRKQLYRAAPPVDSLWSPVLDDPSGGNGHANPDDHADQRR